MWSWENLYQNLEVLEVLLLVSKWLCCLDDVEQIRTVLVKFFMLAQIRSDRTNSELNPLFPRYIKLKCEF